MVLSRIKVIWPILCRTLAKKQKDIDFNDNSIKSVGITLLKVSKVEVKLSTK